MRSVVVLVSRFTILFFLFLFFVSVTHAQSNRGALAGSILDSSGAAVVGAEITAKGVDTGVAYTTSSTSTGAYRLAEMQLGRYDVTVTAQGFKVSENKGIEIQISTTTALDISLEPGNVKEIVTVVADAPTLQTESSDLGTVVGQKQVQQLPLSVAASGQGFIRAPEAFIFLTPGATGPGTNSDHASAGTFETKIGGGQNFGTEVLLDGATTSRMDTSSAFTQIAPSVEALSEFKVTTSTIPAEYGRTSGGVESFSTRSGSNSFHGAAFEIFKNDKLDANGWYNNLLDIAKPRDHKNNYGGTFGGPVTVPKLYNGRDKTFFFFSWEQYREAKGIPVKSTLPTMAERQGDFSALLGAPLTNKGAPVMNPCDGTPVLFGQIFDPSTTKVVNGTPCRTAFPGNKIPSTDFSAVDQAVLTYLPSIPTGAPPQNNFTYTGVNDNLDTAMTVRIDQNLGAQNKLFFSLSKRDFEAPNGPSNLPGPLDGNYVNTYHTYLVRAGLDHFFSPTILNHFTAGLDRINQHSKGTSVTGVDWDKVLGIGNASGQTFPQFSFNGSPTVGYTGFSAANNDSNLPNSLILNDSVSWTVGRHSLKVGGGWTSYQFSILSKANLSPTYTFYNYQTSYTPNSALTGDPFASFILGTPNEESLTVYSVYPRWNSNYFDVYILDDFKARKDLTINLGFRYDVDTPRYEAHNAQSNLSLTAANPGTPGQSGAMVYAPFASLGDTYFKDFGPRVGFAYAPESLFGHIRNIVLRGGYSIYYAPLTYSDFGGSFTSGASANPDFKSTDNFTPQQSPDLGFPTYTPPSFASDPTLFNGGSPNYVAPQYGKPGMVQNWNLELQKQLARDLILSVGYVGMHSTRLRSSLAQINNLNPQYYNLRGNIPVSAACPQGGAYDPTVLNAAYNSCPGAAALADLGVSVPTWMSTLWGSGLQVGQVLKPYPQFNTIGTDGGLENLGQSTYNALLAKLERRFRNGLNLMASYTFSKTLTDADSNYPLFTAFSSGVWAQDSFNLKNDKAVSFQDIPHTFVLSYVYELPVGPNKKFVNKGGVVGKIVGGWQVSGVQRYQSGSPTTFNCYSATGIPYNSGNICFDHTPGQSFLNTGSGSFNYGDAVLALNSSNPPSFSCGQNPQPTNGYFNCAAFADPNSASNVAQQGYRFGNIPRTVGNVRSEHYFNEDFSVIKRTSLYESHAIIFRADLLNAFNRHTFAAFDGNWGSNTFGIPGSGGSGMIVNNPKTVQLSLRYEF